MTKLGKEKREAAENIMGTMGINRLLITISLPMIISMLVSALFNLIDSIFVAQLSEDALAAVSLAYPVQSLMTAAGAGLGVGINALLAGSLGEKNPKKANRVAGNGLFLSTICACAFAVFGIFFTNLYFSSQTDSAAVIGYGNQYLTICCIGSFGLFYEFAFNKLLQATGCTKYMLFEQSIVVALKLILDPILIMGLFGLPALGVVGAALTTVIGQFAGTVASLIFNVKKNKDIHLSVRLMKPDGKLIRDICYIGVPSAMMLSTGSVMSYGINRILTTFTTTATAVFGIYFKLQSFVMMPVQGLNNAMVPIVSYNAGAGKRDRIRKVIVCSLLYAVGITVIGTALIWGFTGKILFLFNASEAMLEIGIPALRIISLNFLFAGFNAIISSICQAMRRSISSLMISLVRQIIVLLPVAYALAQLGGLDAVWWAFPIAEVCGFLLCVVLLGRLMRPLYGTDNT